MSPGNMFIDRAIDNYMAQGDPMANMFTKWFQGRGIRQTKEDEEKTAPPDDSAYCGTPLTEGPYRAADPQPEKLKWVTYERTGSRESWFLSFPQTLTKLLIAYLVLLYTFDFGRPAYDAPIRLGQCIAALCAVWCGLYVRFKKVPA